MKTYRHIIFDWDGTIAMTLEPWFNSINSTLNDYKISHTDRDVIDAIGNLWGLTDKGLKKEEWDPFKARLFGYFSHKTENFALYDGAAREIRNLKLAGKQLAIVTTASKYVLQHNLKKTGLKECFDFVVSGSDVSRRKPDPEGINKVIAFFKSEKESTVMIGDSMHDLITAKNAGIDSILFYPNENERFYSLEELKIYNPTFIAHSYIELRDILK